jgi:glycosyltransferase involved in cell wall biosynthesis
MAKLSIVLPVYNVSSYLDECLESLRAQTFGDFEALCVDDGSTDGSGDILRKAAERDPRIKVFSQENKGVGAARNLALDNASGEWIGFLDADDTIAPDWFERMMSHAADGIDIVHAHSSYCFNGIKQYSNGSYRTFLRDGWSPLNFVRKTAIGKTRYKEGMRFKEDVVFFTELGLKTSRIAWVNEKGYNYRMREGSAINQHIRDEDCLDFFENMANLDLPRDDFGMTIGFDLVLWTRGRNWEKKYDPAKCKVLAFWRDGIKSGKLRYSDVRWWWRFGVWRWIETGNLAPLKKTIDLRVKAELFVRGLK